MKKIPVRQIKEGNQEQSSAERFTIRRVQDITKGKDLIHDLHRHDFFFILVIQKGEGLHEIDFTSYKVLDNSVFILRPGQVHQLKLNAACTGFLIEFNTEFYHPTEKIYSQRFRKLTTKDFFQLDTDRIEKLNSTLTYIFREYSERQENYMDIIKANLEIFFIEMARQSQVPGTFTKTNTPYSQERLEEFLELLEKHLATNKQVSYYTDLMNLSSYQLNEITKATINKTPSELINEQIILEARRQLLATPNQVKDIADHLGYEDVSYFIRFFKKHTGSSPELFRQNFR